VNRALAVVFLVIGCARAREPIHAKDSGSPLDGCTSELRDGATTWSCGPAFLAMDASVNEVASDDSILKNFEAFVEPFGKDVVARDDKPRTIRGVAHPAVSVRVNLPERGRFVATMVVVRRAQHTRVITCSAKETDAVRCDAVITHLAGRAMDAP
jgi:hypothetical protein